MPVVERIALTIGVSIPGFGELRPAIANALASEAQSPKQRRCVHEIKDDSASGLADLVVIQRQRLADLTKVQVVESAMPPIVHLEEVRIAGPVGLARNHPADAILGASLHLHDVCDGVVGPAVEWLHFDRATANIFGVSVLAHFLKAKGVQTKDY